MASPTIGHTHCPECGHDKAEVRQSPKCIYRHCSACKALYHANSEKQAERLRAKMVPVEGAGPAPAPAPDKPEPSKAPKNEPAKPIKPAPKTAPEPVPEAPPTPTPKPARRSWADI